MRILLPLLLLAALFPLVATRYTLFVGNTVLIAVILSIGLNLLIGYAGLLAFLNGALFGVGAYAVAILRGTWHLPFWLAWPAASLIAAAAGLAVAWPALRLSGLYLALATIAAAQFALWVFLHWDSFTGGPAGLQVTPILYNLAPPEIAHYYLCLVTAVLITLATTNLLRSRIGRAFVAIRESEVAAASLAIDPVCTKTLAYVISALYAGIAGGLFAPLLGLVVPESFDMFQIVSQFAMVVVGGLGSLAGSIIGAAFIITAGEALRAFKDFQEIAFGGLILLAVLFLPRGIAGLLPREPLRRP
jgi:branched-chain amino acid transport system permease protein